MKNVANTIEDLLEILAGLQGQTKMQIESSDATIMHSIARQTFKGTAMTDRQFHLMKEKLQAYRSQFTALDYNFDLAVENLRLPMRMIDRSKYMTIVSHADMLGPNSVYESYKQNWKWIKVRFPFSKKDIMSVQECANKAKKDGYYHEKQSHEHFFHFNEINSYNLVKHFEQKQFTIDEEIIKIAREVESIALDRKNYVPSFQHNTLFNLKNDVVKSIKQDTNMDYLKIVDRHRMYGIIDYTTHDPITLNEKIAFRKDKSFLAKPSEISINQLANSLYELDRFPLLVVLEDKNAYNQLYEIYKAFNSFVSNEEQCVLFRQENQTDFNDFVKQKELNNWLDNNTKIVYINTSKLPKLCLSVDWKPISCITYNSFCNQLVNIYMNRCDLIIAREEDTSPFRRYSTKYGIL